MVDDFLPVGIIDDMASVVFAQEKKWGRIESKLAADGVQQEVESGWQGNCKGVRWEKGNQESIVPQGAGSVRRNGLRSDN